MLKTLKEYPSLILNAFKRFPLAIAFAILSSIAIIFDSVELSKLFPQKTTFNQSLDLWLCIYPIAAMLIALATSLIQESRKSTRKAPQIITSVGWLLISVTLVICKFTTDNYYDSKFINVVITSIFTISILAILIGPFWNQKNDNAFWVYCKKMGKQAIIPTINTTFSLLVPIILLVIIGAISESNKDLCIKAIILIFIFYIFTVSPILFMTGIPSIDKCIEETPTLKNFVITIKSKWFNISFDYFKFIILPLYAIYALTVHFYDTAALLQWSFSTRTIFYLAIISLVLVHIIKNEYYPALINPEPSSEKKIAKILSYTYFIPIVTATIAIIQRFSEYGVTENRITASALCIIICICAILDCIPKIIPSKYVIIISCLMLVSLAIGPTITRNAWLKNIKETLATEGYSTFPLNEKDAKEFFSNLWEKDGKKASIAAYQVKELHSRHDEKLYQYFPKESNLADITKKVRTIMGSAHNNKIDKWRPKILFKGNRDYSIDKIYDIPTNAKQVVRIVKKFNEDEYEIKGDSLLFQIKPQKSDKTYHFTYLYKASPRTIPCTPEQLEQAKQKKKPQAYLSHFRCTDPNFRNFIEAEDSAQIDLQKINLSIKEINGKIVSEFSLEGLMFMK